MQVKPFPEFKNIRAIMIPFAGVFDLMTVNVFALGKGPITLIDTGPKISVAMSSIREGFDAVGLNINDIERIIFTHGHVDHFGLAARIQEVVEHPIKFFIHPEDAWRVSAKSFQEGLWNEGIEELKVMVDMPQNALERVKRRFSGFFTLCDPLDDILFMRDDDEFIGDGYHLKVIHTPGHSPGMCCLYESTQRILFSGDHIIKHITPNPVIELRRDRFQNPDYQSLKAYMASLEKIAGLEVNFVFPGHGEYVVDLPGIISEYREHHAQRMELVWHAIKKKTQPLYYLVNDIFPDLTETDLFLALSEIIAHLEILISEGRAVLADPGPPALYRAL